MNRFSFLLMAVLSVAFSCCVHPKAYSPATGRIRTVSLPTSTAHLERGRYLANHVAVCMDCHSKRDYNRLAGPVIAGTVGGGGAEFGKNYGLPGTYYAKNITPFALKSWSDTELLLAITAGVSRNGKSLFPLMPYANYGKMDENDALAILAYLRTLEPVENAVPESKPTGPLKLAMKMMPHKARFQPVPKAENGAEYGRYLVTMAGCADCHTKRAMGGLVKKAAFAGGTEITMAGGTLRSANITPDVETGIGAWTKEAFIRRFKTFDPATFNAPEVRNGYNTVMPWSMYAGMSEQDLGAIYEYLKTVRPVRNRVEVFVSNKR
ncbi:c-type cytochrome [Larkinella insperata]|uniref:C-type cytochrome n=1 Tax=Larkinella insperata TaxID=332158 RepID=A0ABW3QI56_9BACT|nr:c-type cytochrome [Larkinella insperata]